MKAIIMVLVYGEVDTRLSGEASAFLWKKTNLIFLG